MTICPFMSRPVVTMEQIGEYRKADTPELFIVGCLREKCAAWGPVFYPSINATSCDPDYGCRLIGGEVPE